MNKRTRSPRTTILWIILGIIGLAIIIGIVYFVFMNSSDKNNNYNAEKRETKQQRPSHKKVTINVNSPEFIQEFMQTPQTEGYKGFKIGTSKKEIEKKFGKSDGTREINGNDARQYGDMAVTYNHDDKVDHVYVTPNQMTKKAFTDVHNEPGAIRGDIWFYETNIYDGFSIKVFTSRQYIKAIENVPQT
ncbi:zinc ribbon domain-containing protein [Staphylococcus debuckii]|uniref:zinc ribbon domain-containing protein n=1 Tax=Staphylococcus debuckii TaxID=2044912 RepID=UPI000F437FC9|nr:zinc ribbon domain-containing protein [Staphylococcus debuckii]AYU54205.1 zinc ribbon domain-containing protein [Staphylococcus debuckii]